MTVVFKAESIPAGAEAAVRDAGGRVDLRIPQIGVMQVTGPLRLLRAFNADASVQAASPSVGISLDPIESEGFLEEGQGVDPGSADLYQERQWDIKQVTDDSASFALGTGSHETVVAVLDSGINTRHPDLEANLLGGRNFVPDGPGGAIDPEDIEDRNGHGSHVAGAIAANGRILGVGPDLGIRMYRVLGANNTGNTAWTDAAIVAAADDDVDVISMSLSGFYAISQAYWTAPDGTVEKFRQLAEHLSRQRAVRYALRSGAVVVASAGNNRLNLANPTEATAFLNENYGPYGYRIIGATFIDPATLPGVMAISATGPDTSLSSYSNYGPGAISLAAPGGDLLRYDEPGWWTDMCFGANREEDGDPARYTWRRGTSMAAPKVAAVAALIIDREKARGRRLQPSQVVTRLQQSAVDLGSPGYDREYGHGMVNAVNALLGR